MTESMITLVNNFNKAFPKCQMTDVSQRTSVIEQLNEDNGKFRELELIDINGYSFCDDFAGKLTSFAHISGHDGCLLKNCDGIHIFEHNGEKYLMLSELKSKYSTDAIDKAKMQLIGSYLKLMAVLQVLQGFDVHDYHIFGVIAAYRPTEEMLSAISKRDDSISAFAIKLNADQKYLMSTHKCQMCCQMCYCPLNVGDFLIVYVPVENGSQKCSVSIEDILQRV